MILSSPAFKAGSAIPVRYTCDGANVSPPLQWGAIPKDTTELVLFVVNFNGHSASGGPLISWAVAGLQPTLKGLAAGALPAGAIVGRNSLGQSRYSICPPKGHTERYIVSLFALQHPVSASPGFDASAVHETIVHTAEHNGLTIFSYNRT